MPGLDEKRGIHGQQILKAGTISFDGSGIDCLVRKMSGYGANLEVESQNGIPSSFDLVIDTEHGNHHCRVIWRKARPENPAGMRCIVGMEQKFLDLVKDEKSGGQHGSNNALPEMRKTNGPGCHHLRPHRPPMHKL